MVVFEECASMHMNSCHNSIIIVYAELTWVTSDTSILNVGAVACVAVVGTALQRCLCTTAGNVVNEDWPTALTILRTWKYTDTYTYITQWSIPNKHDYMLHYTRGGEVELPTEHSGISGVPSIVTHRPPASIDTHLHSALKVIATTTDQPHHPTETHNCRDECTSILRWQTCKISQGYETHLLWRTRSYY